MSSVRVFARENVYSIVFRSVSFVLLVYIVGFLCFANIAQTLSVSDGSNGHSGRRIQVE